MTTYNLITRSDSSFLLPLTIARMGDDAGRAFIDFFTAQIRNPNTRAAYFRNVRRFLEWVEGSGLRLDAIEPYHVAAFIELIGQRYSAPTVKQHLAALRMLGSFLVIRQVLPKNPAADVRGPKHVVTVGKTPVLVGADARALFESIEAEQARRGTL